MEGASVEAAPLLPPCQWSLDLLTVEEKNAIASMRTQDPVLTAALTDHELALFALGRKLDVGRALTLLKANNEWRKEHNVRVEELIGIICWVLALDVARILSCFCFFFCSVCSVCLLSHGFDSTSSVARSSLECCFLFVLNVFFAFVSAGGAVDARAAWSREEHSDERRVSVLRV
jgi:hypothetical protein